MNPMKPMHTTEPWKAVVGPKWPIMMDDGSSFVSRSIDINGADGTRIAAVMMMSTNGFVQNAFEATANARVIVMAPQLLTTLKDTLAVADELGTEAPNAEAIRAMIELVESNRPTMGIGIATENTKPTSK